jgi:hypothetical protein
LLIDCIDRRHLHVLDGLTRCALDGAQHVALARSNEKDCLAAAPGTAGAADAVHIRFRVVRHVVIDHVTDALDIETACGHIRRYQNIDLAILEPADRPFADVLRDVAV